MTDPDRARSKLAPWTAAGAGALLLRAALKSLNKFDYSGATVLVTGGSRGLGLILARRLAEAGARVAICARNPDELDRALDDLSRRGGRTYAVPYDLTIQDRVDEMVAVVERQIGPIDVLINNAGAMLVAPFETLDAGDFEAALRENFLSAVYTTLAVAPSMRRRRRGRIVNITSIGGKVSVPHLLPYSASKFALVGFSEGLRSELAGTGIKVTTVCPGLMRTGSPRHAKFKGRARDEFDWFVTSASAPGLSMSADRAARKILAAVARGESEVVLSLPANAATLVHGIAPGFTSSLLGVAGRLLPDADGGTARPTSGKQLEGTVARWRSILTDRAASRNNEVAADE